MTSAIDPTKPEDGVPASKAELRANLEAVKSELEHGGFAGAFGPARYGPPASDRVADHLAAIDSALGTLGSFSGLADTPSDYTAQGARFVKVKADESGLEFAPAPGGSGGLTGWTDVKVDFGATGDGATDDTAALQAALASGAAVVYLPPGTYRISASLSVIPGTTVLGAGPGQTVIDATGLPDQIDPAALHCYGTPVALPALAGGPNEGDKEVIFSATVDAAVREWDVIAVLDERDFSFASTIAAARDGAMVNVLDVEGTKVVCASGMPRKLPSQRISGGGLGDLTAVRLDRRGIHLESFSLDCRGLGLSPTSTSSRGIGISLRWLADALVRRVHVRGAPTYGLDIDRCARARITEVVATANSSGWTSGSGLYGIYVGGSAYCTISDSYIAGGRHALDFSHGGGEQPVRQMPAHDNLVIGCTLETPAENDYVAPDSVVTWAMSWHEGTYNCHVQDSIINGGMAFRGFGHKIINNHVWMPKQDANLPAVDGDHMGPRFGIIFRGNYVRSYTPNNAIQIDWDSLENIEDPGVCDISDNIFDLRGSTTKEVILFTSGPAASKAYVKIHDNLVISANNQSFVNISSKNGAFVRVSVLNNQLTSSMSLGTVSNVDSYRALNMIGDDLHFANLPTTSPGGAGRLWSDGGTLKIT